MGWEEAATLPVSPLMETRGPLDHSAFSPVASTQAASPGETDYPGGGRKRMEQVPGVTSEWTGAPGAELSGPTPHL